MVGWLEGLEGLCSLFFAIPFGTLADRWRRDRVLRISSCIELGAGICSAAMPSDMLSWFTLRYPPSATDRLCSLCTLVF